MKVFLCTVPGNREKHVSAGRAISTPAPQEAVQPRGDQSGQVTLGPCGFLSICSGGLLLSCAAGGCSRPPAASSSSFGNSLRKLCYF